MKENYKIRVKNEAESEEAQELFFKLGYQWFIFGAKVMLLRDSKFISAHNNGDLSMSRLGSPETKEITLPQLRDLVVLKRNDAGDANAYCNDNSEHYYISSKGEYFFYFEGYEVKKWMHSSNHISYLKKYVKPIDNIMKEYLRKDLDGNYVLEVATVAESKEHHARDWIEIPEGSEVAYFFNGSDLKCREDDICFYKDDIGLIYYGNGWNEIDDNNVKPFVLSKGKLLWQRHTQPEELPFTDEPNIKYMDGCSLGRTESLNDQYAEIEQVRQAKTETESLTQGANSDRLKASIEKFKNTDHGAEFDNFELLPRAASEIADAALTHIRERASTYDQPEGERSAAKTAQAFNTITGHKISESEVWLMLQILKDVRQWSRDTYHQDSAEDSIAYAALKAESLERNK